jgi:hypothetical protein
MEITPHTRIGALLEAHPELEAVLVAAAPAFEKLKNPVLRATVAKIATLEQAARIGGLPLPELVGLLRRELSMDPGTRMRVPGGQAGPEAAEAGASQVLEAWPAWVRAEEVAVTLDAAAILEAGGHPLAAVQQALRAHPGAIVLLRSDFEPAPLLAEVRQRGLEAACVKDGERYRTALRAPSA